MGLFDGAATRRSRRGFASTAHVAAAAARAGRAGRRRRRAGAAASPPWCTASPPSTRPCASAGVILNRVGTDRHEEILREALDAAGVPVLGARPPRRRAGHAVPAPRAGPGRRALGRGGARP